MKMTLPSLALLSLALGAVATHAEEAAPPAAGPEAAHASANDGAPPDVTTAAHVHEAAHEAAHSEEHAHHEPAENGISARLIGGGGAVSGEPVETLVGGGVAYEHVFAHGLVAVEVALEALSTAEGTSIPLEVVVEKPIEVSEGVEVYFGGGPTVATHVADGDVRVAFGGLALAGALFEIAGPLAGFVEADGAMFFYDEPDLEADVGAGLMVHF